jgi:hypothetical protein
VSLALSDSPTIVVCPLLLDPALGQVNTHVLYVLQHGLIAGGLADGSIALWDAQQILRGRPESAQLSKETKHHGAVSPQSHTPSIC